MEAVWNAIKSLKRWQMVTLLLVILGAASATYGIYSRVSAAGQVELAEDQQLIPVRSGNLINQVSTSGNLVFPEKESLTFGSAGTVLEVLVTTGQQVAKSQALARLDLAAVASAEEAVAQSRLDLQNAQQAQAALEVEHALQLAQAEESVADAEFQLQEAREALEDARQPHTAEAIRTQQEAVASARLALQDAQEALANLESDYASRLAQARQTKADAETALEDARDALADLESNHSLELATATQAKADAEVGLKQAEEALADYEATNGQWLGSLRLEKAEAEARLEEAQSTLDRLVLAQESVSGDLTHSIRQWEQFVEDRKDVLASLQADLAQVEQLEAKVELAQEEVEKAGQDLERLEAGLGPLERQKLETAEQAALADLAMAESKLAALTSEVDPLELALKEAQVAKARAALAQAEEDLEEMLRGADSLQVALKEKQVALAEATLAQAQKDRAKLEGGLDPLEAALREAQVASTQEALADAIQRREDTNLKAPIVGLVSLVNVEAGDKVEANTVIVEVVDTTVIEVDGVVDEIDVLSVTEGTPVQVTLDALPGQVLEGTVTEIAPAAQNQQGVVTYPIKVQAAVPEGVRVREGLTAVANIVLSEERDVLLVPEQALRGSFNQPTVQVMTSQGVETKPVVLGNTDGFWVAVRQGPEEGDQVIMESAQVITTNQFGFRQFRAAPVSGGATFRGRGR